MLPQSSVSRIRVVSNTNGAERRQALPPPDARKRRSA
jgi:hypothetical protein